MSDQTEDLEAGDGEEEVDQDALMAEWEAMAGDEDDVEGNADEVAADAVGADDAMDGATARVLDQDEIDSLLGLSDDGNARTTRESRRFSTPHWCRTNACRCSRWCSIAWYG